MSSPQVCNQCRKPLVMTTRSLRARDRAARVAQNSEQMSALPMIRVAGLGLLSCAIALLAILLVVAL